MLAISVLFSGIGMTGHAAELFGNDAALPEGTRGDSGLDAGISSEEFIVGSTTELSGKFFTNMWGNNASDVDVRTMLHGYETVYWSTQTTFEINPTVIRESAVETLPNGDRLYTLTVWDDLTYNDGTPIDARDYAFSFLLSAAPQIAQIGGLTSNNEHVKGWEAYANGRLPFFSGIRLLDRYTFSVEIQAEYLPFFYEQGMVVAIPYPISVIAPGCEVADDGLGAFIQNTDRSQPEIFTAETLRKTILDPQEGYLSRPHVTSGPWQLERFDWDTRILKAKRNPRFKGNWEGQKPAIETIVVKSVAPGTLVGALERGEVHLLNKVVAGEDITEGLELLKAGGTNMESYPRTGLGFINFACEMGPSQSQAVRQAVAYGMGLQEFVEEYTQHYGKRVYGYYGIGQWMLEMLSGRNDEGEATPEEVAAWGELSMEGLNPYAMNREKARQLLVEDGWTLNEAGGPFVDGTDAVRAKVVDGQLMPLRLKFGKTKGSTGAEMLWKRLETLAEIGIAVEMTEVPFVEVLEHHYRQRERTYHMLYLGTNFFRIFDPYFAFHTQDKYQGLRNTSGYRDAELEKLALELRETQPGALLEYTQRWLRFQHAFNEKLPMLPLYSNAYFDFFTNKLQGYTPDSERYNWPEALLYAHLAEPSTGAENE